MAKAKDTHVTAPTRLVEANGIRYAYRRFGSESGTPLVFLQHFRGGLDNWDPLVTDGLAQGRPVILFNNAGVARADLQFTADVIRSCSARARRASS
jgi:pimeloyl-ACP methyl ester carboxylesterase